MYDLNELTSSTDGESTPYPVADLHCDMLHYLVTDASADPDNREAIGCAIPHLRQGNVKFQVMAIYTNDIEHGVDIALMQSKRFERLLRENGSDLISADDMGRLPAIQQYRKTCVVASIESASCLCTEEEPLSYAFDRLEQISKRTGRILYISLTHHGENRFGGGNITSAGLKSDGRVLLDYLDGKGIALDLSHASDKLATDSVDWIDRQGHRIPIIASHSNFRAVYDHPRNLPDELARFIIARDGVIGMNFLRAFLHPDDARLLRRHILHGFELGGERTLCFGADFFCTHAHPDKSRIPFYFKEHENAGKYQSILKSLTDVLNAEHLDNLAHRNALRFVEHTWHTSESS